MNTIIFLAVLVCTLILAVSIVLLTIIMLDSVTRGHDLPTSNRAMKGILKIIKEQKVRGNFYDLGCAHGSLAVRIKKILPDITIVGIDNNPIRIRFAKVVAKIFHRDIRFLYADIFDVDLSNADILYTYLWYDLMPILEKKLLNELKPGAIVITNTSHFPTWEPIQTVVTYPGVVMTPDFETLFVYKKT